jgi:DNA-directed RNA polymerase subunit RPC12/RpoP
MMSKCPTCGASVSFLTGSYIDIRGPDQSWVGVSYVCPKCDAILGISPDPMTLRNDLAEIFRSLDRRSDDGS